MTPSNVLIRGGGLAGVTLAWALARRSVPFQIVDEERPITSSRIAAGLMTPITGKRLKESHRWREFFPMAVEFYRRVESQLACTVFVPKSIVRLLTSKAEAGRLDRSSDLVSVATPTLPDFVRAPFGAFEMPCAGQLRVRDYVEKSLRYFASLTPPQCQPDVTIWCEGYRPDPIDAFASVPMRPAKGEILTVRLPGVMEHRVINCGGFWLTQHVDDVYHFGATYSWDPLDCIPTPEGRADLEDRLRNMISVPFDVVDHQAAVRPITVGQRPRLGFHPMHPNLGYFNGLSSKGALLAPYYAGMLADALLGRGNIEADVNVATVLHESLPHP
jgi:glycine/D-amino acid oxidase-like deaminating enzyme